MWAIKPNGPQMPVSARRIKPDWELKAGETAILSDDQYQPGYVLDEDGITVRAPTREDLDAQEAKQEQNEQNEMAKLFDTGIGLALFEEIWKHRQETGKTGGLSKEEFKSALVSRYASGRPKT